MMEKFGGAMMVLMIGHMIGDWLLQNQWMADRKTKNLWVRTLHVTIYTFVLWNVMVFWWNDPAVWLNRKDDLSWLACWIFWSHFVIDSYKPLYWFRRLGRDPQTKSIETFRAHFGTPSGFMVYVTLDQVFHMVTLLPVAWYLVSGNLA